MSKYEIIIAELEAERATIDKALDAIRALAERNGAPTPAKKLPKKQPNRRRQRASRSDWELGRKLWDAGKTAAEIAERLGCPDKTVYSAASRYNWPKRNKKKAEREKIAMTKCPQCGAFTNLNPCEMCHIRIAVGDVGAK